MCTYTIFFGGYTYARNTSYRSIIIGEPSDEIEDQIDILYEINDKSEADFLIINDFIAMFIGESVEPVSVDQDHPDLYIWLNSKTPTMNYRVLSFKIWFTSDGGIIGNRKGMTWDDVNYNIITKDQAEYIKEFLRQNSSSN